MICPIKHGLLALKVLCILWLVIQVVQLAGCAAPEPTFRPTLPPHLEAQVFERAAVVPRSERTELERLVVEAGCRDGRAPPPACSD